MAQQGMAGRRPPGIQAFLTCAVYLPAGAAGQGQGVAEARREAAHVGLLRGQSCRFMCFHGEMPAGLLIEAPVRVMLQLGLDMIESRIGANAPPDGVGLGLTYRSSAGSMGGATQR